MARRGVKAAAARLVLLASLAVLGAALGASPALASEPIESFNLTSSTSQAGAHPDLTASFELAHPGEPESARNVTFNAPGGVFGNADVVPECTASDFALNRCPSDSQAGLATIYANYEGNPHYLLGTTPIYEVEPQAGETARFALNVPILNIPIAIPVAVRTGGDYGLRFTVQDITQVTPLAGAKLTFWGFPADQEHNGERFPKGTPGNPPGCLESTSASCVGQGVKPTKNPEPLTDNPTLCTGAPLESSLEVQTYQDPTHPTVVKGDFPATTGCDRLTFNPVVQAGVTTGETDAPSGLNLELAVQQFLGRAASPSELKAATVLLPEGLTINPDAADGQRACLDSQANFGGEGPTGCPDNSKIGTFTVLSPALAGALQGAVYIGEPKPDDQYRLFLVASGFGINAKFIGSIVPNPLTGRLTAIFDNLPQVPFEKFQIHLFASDRGLMATPTTCTIYRTSGEFYPWDTALPEEESAQVFGLSTGPHGAPCPGQVRPFTPSLVAGTSNPIGGAFTSFALKLDREDGDQNLGKLNFTMPPGLTGDLRGISYCPDSAIIAASLKLGRVEQANPSCPASSQVGTTNVAAGPGSHPFHAAGKLYLGGPYRGAPLSLAAVTPALAGPYDYGVVVVRVALNIDPLDAHVIADSETVPRIIGGIPIRLRSIEVSIDKPNFMINPTNCDPTKVVSEGVGDEGTNARFSSYFHVANCSQLPFKPRFTVTQLGRHATKRGNDPSVRFDLYTRRGDANLKSAAVTLPTAFEIDQRHLTNICSKAQLERERCAGRQPIGKVEVQTPLLDKPLAGLAYAVSGYGKLPHLAFILTGQVTLVPEAKSSSVKGGHLRTVVPVIPDAPVGHFRLTLYGGKKGYLTNTRSLCGKPSYTGVTYVGQNGKLRAQRAKTRTSC